MRKIIKLAVFLVLLNGFYRFGSVYLKDVSLRWDVKEAAHAWQNLSQTQVEDEVLALVEKNNVPITRQHLAIRSTGSRVAIDIAYVRPIEFFPGWRYPWTFENTIETWTLNRGVNAR